MADSNTDNNMIHEDTATDAGRIVHLEKIISMEEEMDTRILPPLVLV